MAETITREEVQALLDARMALSAADDRLIAARRYFRQAAVAASTPTFHTERAAKVRDLMDAIQALRDEVAAYIGDNV